jgi:large subunit ribosomal protein L35
MLERFPNRSACYTVEGRKSPRKSPEMPKLKSHKGASKRFKRTGTGKFVRNKAFARHILTLKSRSRKRSLHEGPVADASDQHKIRTMLPYA